jgi:hypothetical protein
VALKQPVSIGDVNAIRALRERPDDADLAPS